jgi:hypothetical protein
MVISQALIQGEPATEEQIGETMGLKSFKAFGDGVYYSQDEGLLIHDMHPPNAVFSRGRAVPIDTFIRRVTPEFADWVSRNARILKNQGKLPYGGPFSGMNETATPISRPRATHPFRRCLVASPDE